MSYLYPLYPIYRMVTPLIPSDIQQECSVTSSSSQSSGSLGELIMLLAISCFMSLLANSQAYLLYIPQHTLSMYSRHSMWNSVHVGSMTLKLWLLKDVHPLSPLFNQWLGDSFSCHNFNSVLMIFWKFRKTNARLALIILPTHPHTHTHTHTYQQQ